MISRGNWTHNKTGHVYWIITTCINATNSGISEEMVIYWRDRLYVREKGEFLERFTKVPDED